jgi:hypothetical protein
MERELPEDNAEAGQNLVTIKRTKEYQNEFH